MKDTKFLAYLQYLMYLGQAPYCSLLQYPNGLEMLRLLNRQDFRRQLCESPAAIIDYIHKQQYHHWAHLNKI